MNFDGDSWEANNNIDSEFGHPNSFLQKKPSPASQDDQTHHRHHETDFQHHFLIKRKAVVSDQENPKIQSATEVFK